MECHHIVTNGPIVSKIHHEALVAIDTVIAHKLTRCQTYLKPYQHFTIRLSRFNCYKQDDSFPFDKMQHSPLNRSMLIKGEDGYLTGSQHSASVVRIQCSTGPFRTLL